MNRIMTAVKKVMPRRMKEGIKGIIGRVKRAAWHRKISRLPYPPHEYKVETVAEYARKYKCDTLIETGTYLGDMISGVYDKFNYIASVELGEELYKRAVEKFSAEKVGDSISRKIHLYNGDSGKMLPKMISGRQNAGGGLRSSSGLMRIILAA